MNITRKDVDAVNAVLTVQIAKADYAEKVEKTLKDYRRKANVPGFRPGMVPVGLVKKMYGKAVLAEEVNKTLSDGLFGYIRENNLQVLGEPLPNETEQKPVNFDTDEDFEFVFDVALAPEINISLDKKIKITEYEIAVDEKMVENQIQSYKSRFGRYEQEDVAEEKDVLRGDIQEVGGEIVAKDVVISAQHIKSATQKKLFIGAKKGDVVKFSPNKAYKGNETEIAALLKIDKEKAKDLTSEFEYTINTITRYFEAELNQDLFDKVYGEKVVTSEDEFRSKIEEEIKASLKINSDYKFALDTKQVLLKKAEKVEFPEAFLKRWLLATNEKMTEEVIEKDFPKMLEELKWQVISDKLVKENEIKVEQSDLLEQAKKTTRSQFAQYGMMNIPDDILDSYANEMLKKQESVENLARQAMEDKLLEVVKNAISLQKESISMEDFGKLFEK
ncbi:MAG: trigger factor [Paludibacteraceae bacterium]|nr:trigger factor [Paludibacteraceae bacterium]